MARRNTLLEKAQRVGMAVDEFVKFVYEENDCNIFKSAIAMGCYPNTIYYHLRRMKEMALRAELEPLLVTSRKMHWRLVDFNWKKGQIVEVVLKLYYKTEKQKDVAPMVVALADAERFLPIVNAETTNDDTLRTAKR